MTSKLFDLNFYMTQLTAAGNLNDLYTMDAMQLSGWIRIDDSVAGIPPCPRNGHGFASVGEKLYVFGGLGGDLESPGTVGV